MASQRHKIIGTAGHIDHGKSRLVRILTGSDPDRLAEEQERGMTIDLGFAFLQKNIAFIDVPGHEKFIKNMVAGVSTIDIALFVVAADDGVMPQTREHLDILNLLNVRHGIIVLSKIDLVEKEWIDMVEEDIRNLVKHTFLEKAPVFRVSAETGVGIEALRQAIVQMAESLPDRVNRGLFWMPIDRSFTIKGHGTVVTGSVLSGSIQSGESLELLPARRSLRIRGIQTHGHPAKTATIGDRAALNVQNISKNDITRGDVLASPNVFSPSRLLDATLYLLPSAAKSITHLTRVRLHLGTRELMARVKLLGTDRIESGDKAFVQFVCESETVAQKGDPFVIRQYSPQITIGGGLILDTNPSPHKRSDINIVQHLQKLETFDPHETIETLARHHTDNLTLDDISKLSGVELEDINTVVNDLVSQGKLIIHSKKPIYLHSIAYDEFLEEIRNRVDQFHRREPLRLGITKANLLAQISDISNDWFQHALDGLIEQEELELREGLIKNASFEIQLKPVEQHLADKIYELLDKAEFAPPPIKIIARELYTSADKVLELLGVLQAREKVMRFEGDLYFTRQNIEKAKEQLLSLTKQEFTVGEFREMLNTSRKYVLPILGYFDETGVTLRSGDIRVINKR